MAERFIGSKNQHYQVAVKNASQQPSDRSNGDINSRGNELATHAKNSENVTSRTSELQHQVECVETKFFELLEKRSVNDSFLSNSSFVDEVVKSFKTASRSTKGYQDLKEINNVLNLVDQYLKMNDKQIVVATDSHPPPELYDVVDELHDLFKMYCNCSERGNLKDYSANNMSVLSNTCSVSNAELNIASKSVPPYVTSLIDTLSGKIKYLNDKVSEYEREISLAHSMQQDFKIAKDIADKCLKERLAELEEQKSLLDKRLKRLAKEKELFHTHSASLRNRPKVTELTEKIKKLKEQLASTEHDLQDKTKHFKAAEASLRTQLQQLIKEYQQLSNMNVGLIAELKSIKQDMSNKQKTGKNPKTSSLQEVTNFIETCPKDILNSFVEEAPCSFSSEPQRVSINDQSDHVLVPWSAAACSDSVNEQDDGELQSDSVHCMPVALDLPTVVSGSHIEFQDDTVKVVRFSNGDLQSVYHDGRLVYVYESTGTGHIIFPSGFEILKFTSGQVEKRFPDGKTEVTYPDGTKQVNYPDGLEQWYFTNHIIASRSDDLVTVNFPNGEIEQYFGDRTIRCFPSGTRKILYSDGSTETKYSDGRVRVKNRMGLITYDSNATMIADASDDSQ
ncbi:spindle assembly abnormal 4 [Lycorma delicatula]|uniref:spindle assembly abnormal 4 n=1 Tax=Lycorma delicatula TaxID=130591 RepID=UPI003F51434B